MEKGSWLLSPPPIARGVQPEAVDLAAVEALERQPLAPGLDRLQLIADRVEIAGIETLEDPLQVLADLPRDRIAALQERPGATAIFRGSRPLPPDTDRVRSPRLQGEPGFDPDQVVPPLAEVVLVEGPFVGSALEVVEPNGSRAVGEPESAPRWTP